MSAVDTSDEVVERYIAYRREAGLHSSAWLLRALLSERAALTTQLATAEATAREKALREAAALAQKVAIAALSRQKSAGYQIDNARHEGRKLGASAIARSILALIGAPT